MGLSFNKKTIVITGAGNGIGRAASILLANEGAIIISIDKDLKSLKKLKLILKKKCVIKKVDCTKYDEIKKELKDINIVDGLVNCAGIVPQGDIISCTREDWINTINTNLTSVFYITQFFMKKFIHKNSLIFFHDWEKIYTKKKRFYSEYIICRIFYQRC